MRIERDISGEAITRLCTALMILDDAFKESKVPHFEVRYPRRPHRETLARRPQLDYVPGTLTTTLLHTSDIEARYDTQQLDAEHISKRGTEAKIGKLAAPLTLSLGDIVSNPDPRHDSPDFLFAKFSFADQRTLSKQQTLWQKVIDDVADTRTIIPAHEWPAPTEPVIVLAEFPPVSAEDLDFRNQLVASVSGSIKPHRRTHVFLEAPTVINPSIG